MSNVQNNFLKLLITAIIVLGVFIGASVGANVAFVVSGSVTMATSTLLN